MDILRTTFNTRHSTYKLMYLLISASIVIASILNLLLMVKIGSYNLRLSYIIIFFAFIFLLPFSSFRISFEVPYYKLFLFFIFIYFLATIININSKYFTRGIADCLLLSLNFLHYLLIVSFLLKNNDYFHFLFKCLIFTGAILSLIAMILIITKFLGFDIPVFSYYKLSDWIYTNDYSLFPRLKYLEPVSGGFLATISLIGFSYWLLTHNKNKETNWILGASVITFIVMIFSYSRGPILGFMVGFFLLLLLIFIRGKIHKMILIKLLVILLIFITIFLMLYALPMTRNIVFGRIRILLETDIGTVADRISWWKKMFAEFLDRPVLGYGASNYRKFREVGDTVGVSENIYIEIMHSSGILGFGIFVVINLLVIIKSMKIFFKKNLINKYLLSFLCGYACILTIAFTNPIAWSSFFWVVLACLVASSKLLIFPKDQ